MNKDHVTFKVDVVSRGDLGTETDAGDTMEKASSISFQKYPVNYLSAVDRNDTYKFEGQKGDALYRGFIPNDENLPGLNIDIPLEPSRFGNFLSGHQIRLGD